MAMSFWSPQFEKALNLAIGLDQDAYEKISSARHQAKQNFSGSSATTAAQVLRNLNEQLRARRELRLKPLILEIESLLGILRGD